MPRLRFGTICSNTDYGLGVTADELDETSFEDAADVCDEQVAVKPYPIE